MKKVLVIILLFPKIIFAQAKLDTLQFEIIKESINFLATDSKTTKDPGKKANCQSINYDCLKKFCETESIKGGSGKVDEWKQIKCRSIDELKLFSSTIQNQLTNGQGKAYRKSMGSYEEYITSVTQIIEISKKSLKPSTKPDVNNTIPDAVNKNNTSLDTVNIDEKGNDSGMTKEVNEDKPLPYGLILGALAFLLGIYSIYKISTKASLEDTSNIKKELKEAISDISELKTSLVSIKNGELIKPITEKVKTIESKLLQIESNVIVSKTNITEKEETSHITDRELSPQLFFAKLPDLGNGFSQSILSETQNGEQIYEIEIKGDNGTYLISNNFNAQKYALSDFNYYLSSACVFLNQPVKNCKIFTGEYGIIRKISGSWIIQEKAKIEFK